jgi:hypothetical protein
LITGAAVLISRLLVSHKRLERYERACRENEFNWETLVRLTAQDLRDLGVVLGSQRRKLLDAMALLGGA